MANVHERFMRIAGESVVAAMQATSSQLRGRAAQVVSSSLMPTFPL